MSDIRKVLFPIFGVAATSMFYFPFDFRALPGLNTKKLMAVAALLIIVFQIVNKRKFEVSSDFIHISLLASIVSFCGLFSVVYNSTPDYAYASYIMSCWVWWGAAYTLCMFIRWGHNKLTWQLIIKYLIAVCVFQCIIALVMDENKEVKRFVNSIVLQGDLIFYGNVHRLYGIGCELDVAGMRFAAVLVMIMYLLINSREAFRWYHYVLYFSAFFVITVAGNMIARTTIVGVIIALAYLCYVTIKPKSMEDKSKSSISVLWRWIALLLIFSVPILTMLYQTDKNIHDNMRFGFEGFFNYFERGKFSYGSNETLRSMYVWPDNLKTWLIGDGYFDNPINTDVHYTGEVTFGYYKNTDVGYLRFIFYFGIGGLIMFSLFMIRVAQICVARFPEHKILFALLILLHFSVWAKVATDLFLAFAPFLCFSYDEDCISDSGDV